MPSRRAPIAPSHRLLTAAAARPSHGTLALALALGLLLTGGGAG